jgi:hypothetical protein
MRGGPERTVALRRFGESINPIGRVGGGGEMMGGVSQYGGPCAAFCCVACFTTSCITVVHKHQTLFQHTMLLGPINYYDTALDSDAINKRCQTQYQC